VNVSGLTTSCLIGVIAGISAWQRFASHGYTRKGTEMKILDIIERMNKLAWGFIIAQTILAVICYMGNNITGTVINILGVLVWTYVLYQEKNKSLDFKRDLIYTLINIPLAP